MQTHSDVADRASAMLLGVALGDAMGVPAERPGSRHKPADCTGELHEDWFERRRNQWCTTDCDVGAVSDDTEMTMALLSQLAENGGYVPDRVLAAYHKFANADTSTLGENTKALLKGYCAGGKTKPDIGRIKTQYANRFGYRFGTREDALGAQSNGCLMRCSPLALIKDAEHRRNATAIDCALTNPSPTAHACVSFYVELLNALIFQPRDAGDSTVLDGAVETPERTGRALIVGRVRAHLDAVSGVDADATTCPDLDAMLASVMAGIESNPDTPPRVASTTDPTRKVGGWVVTSLAMALWAALRRPDDPNETNYLTLSDRLRDVVRAGGDTDTNAAIAGALIGAQVGYRHLAFVDNVMRKNVKVLHEYTGKSVMTLHNKPSKEKYRPEEYLPRQIEPTLNRLLQRTGGFEHWHYDAAAIAFELDRTSKIIDNLPSRSEIPQAKLVFIAGCSQSGKTTLAANLKKKLGGNVHVVHQDGFCTGSGGAAAGGNSKKRARDEPPNWEGGQFTNWPKMCAEIEHRRTRNLPNAMVIVEGYTLFYDHPELQACRERADAIIVLEIGKETCQKRRRSFPSNGGWGSADDYVRGAVWPHYEEHELPRINRAAGRIIRIDGTRPEEAVTNTTVAALSGAF